MDSKSEPVVGDNTNKEAETQVSEIVEEVVSEAVKAEVSETTKSNDSTETKETEAEVKEEITKAEEKVAEKKEEKEKEKKQVESVTAEVESEVEATKKDDWETEPHPAGLESINPADVELTEKVMKTPPEAKEDPQAWNSKSRAKSTTPSPIKESDPSAAPSFAPVLISSAKKRESVKSTGYGSKVIGRKPPKAVDSPTFKPDLSITEKKRAKSAGSQYGKQVPKKKEIQPKLPTFKPELINVGKTKEIREKAIPKIYDSQKRLAEKGKKERAEHEKKLKETVIVSRYTLAKAETVVETEEKKKDDDKPPMILDAVALASTNKDTVSKSAIAVGANPEPLEVKRSKHGEKLMKKAVSHYTNSTYSLPKGSKAEVKHEKKWLLTPKVSEVPVDKLEVPAKIKKIPKHTANAVSKYGKDYTPPKSARPQTPKHTKELNLAWSESQSPLNKSAAELAQELEPGKKLFKAKNVSSSGYGVISPTPSVPKKVESYKHRGGQDLLRTKNVRDKSSLAESAKPHNDDEKENPVLNENSSALVDDLLNRAAMLDPKAQAPKPTVLSEDNGAEVVEPPVATPTTTEEETQLTML